MGIRRGPNTVTDGLVFAVDAANPTSYTSGSATCKNLIGSNIGSIHNDVDFNSANQGIWVFDGVADYIDCGTTLGDFFGDNYAGDMTVSIWLKLNVTGTQDDGLITIGTPFSGASPYFGDVFLRLKNSYLEFYLNAVWVKKVAFTDTSSWHHLVGVYKAGDSTNSKLYLDGVEQNAGTGAGSFPSTTDMDFAGYKTIIGGYYTTSYCINGDIANVLIYNKHLSDAEVLQNYNALKGRFN